MTYDPNKTCRFCKYVTVWQIDTSFGGVTVKAHCKKEPHVVRGDTFIKRTDLDATFDCFEVRNGG